MSDAEAKEHEPLRSCRAEEEQVQEKGPAGNNDEEQRMRSDEAEERGGVSREETETDTLRMTRQSRVYTATRDTLFPKEITHTRTHALVSTVCLV